MELNNNSSNPSSRALVLTTYREPIQMTVSDIHQICNKNLHRRNQQTLQACMNCNYDMDHEYWDALIDRKTEQLRGAHIVSRMQVEHVDVYSMHVSEIDGFLQLLTNSTVQPHNVEKTLECNFRVPSSMMRRVVAAESIYRNLTLGL